MAYSSVAEHGMNMNSPLSTSAPSYEKAPGSGRRSGSITSRDGDMVSQVNPNNLNLEPGLTLKASLMP